MRKKTNKEFCFKIPYFKHVYKHTDTFQSYEYITPRFFILTFKFSFDIISYVTKDSNNAVQKKYTNRDLENAKTPEMLD